MLSLAIRQFVKRIDVLGLRHRFLNKYYHELEYQKTWAKTFLNSNGPWGKLKNITLEFRCLNEIVETCHITECSTVLDVGCGISTILHFIQGKKFGIDPLADEYKKLYDYPKDMRIRKGFAEKITFVDGKFDVVLCTNVLDHVSNPIKALDEMKRVLNPSGYLAMLVEIFDSGRERDKAHPFSFTKENVYSLMNPRFEVLREFIRPWVAYDFTSNELTVKKDSKSLILIAAPTGGH